jgi:hypothetical protein
MPELSVKDIRLPELHLSEINRDEIKRSAAEIRLPEIDLPRIDLPSVDVGKAVARAAAAAQIGRRPQRPRWRLATVGLIVASLTGWAILTNKELRQRLVTGTSAIRARISALRSNRDRPDIDPDAPIAFSAAETAPMEAGPFTDPTADHATDYPDGLGSNNSDGTPLPDETASAS